MTTIRYTQITSQVAEITLNRPNAHNALNFDAIERFGAAVERAHADPELRVLLVTGAGERAFCAGGDLKELADCITEEDGRKVSAGMTAALRRLEDLPVPTMAVINGLARGGGAEISLACDLRWMSAAATWGFTQVSLAVTPGWGSGQRLLRLVGYARSLTWMVDGRVLDAEEALANGIVQNVISHESLLPEARAWALTVSQKPREVLVGIKRLLRAGIALPPEEAAHIEAGIFPALWAGTAHHQAVSDFLTRRRA